MESYINHNLKVLRKKHRLTQQEIAEVLYVTPQAVSKWERGESLPDISLIPQLAKLYQVSISALWEEPLEENGSKLQQLTDRAHSLVDDQLVQELIADFQNIGDIKEVVIRFDFFHLLNDSQKDAVLAAIIQIPGSAYLVEDFYFYLSHVQKEWLIIELLTKKQYAALELLIPMMTKAIRTIALESCLSNQAIDFLEELLPFLSVSQKQLIVAAVQKQVLELAAIENYLTFFTENQRQLLQGQEEIEED